jgi:putative tryptophan/tyrosine transport system substrate-binding protein
MTEMRRLLIVTLALGILLTPLAAETQPAGRLPRVGFLGNMAPPPPPVSQLDGFLEGLSELGYVEGRNILIEYRWAEGKLERLPTLAAELAQLNVAAMVVAGQQGFDAGRTAAPGVPLVMIACDPLETILGSLARPGANATGVTCVSAELATKRLELLNEVVPKLARVALLYNPGDPNKAVEVRQLETAARALSISLLRIEVDAPERFEEGFAVMRRERVQGLITLADPFMNFHRKRIADLAASHRMAAIYGFAEYADAGGLMSYGASIRWTFRRAAHHVDKILKGAKPADLPVEQPTTFELVINRKTAKALGLTIPGSLLIRADRVIE